LNEEAVEQLPLAQNRRSVRLAARRPICSSPHPNLDHCFHRWGRGCPRHRTGAWCLQDWCPHSPRRRSPPCPSPFCRQRQCPLRCQRPPRRRFPPTSRPLRPPIPCPCLERPGGGAFQDSCGQTTLTGTPTEGVLRCRRCRNDSSRTSARLRPKMPWPPLGEGRRGGGRGAGGRGGDDREAARQERGERLFGVRVSVSEMGRH